MSQPHDRIPLTRPLTGAEELAGVRRVLDSGWLTMGPEVAAFEKEFATSVGAPHACAISSGTAGLYLALRAAGVGPGDEVITVSHTFIATSDAIRFCGALPVYVDIEAGTFNIRADQVKGAITERTRAVLCVHQIGMPCDLGALLPLTREAGLPLIEDAACALGSEIQTGHAWEKIGQPHGDAAVFSFHPRKPITTGDGGMITTRHAEWDRLFRLWRQHGMSVQAHDRHRSDKVVFESYIEPGFNFRMTDLQAAVGRAQLQRLPEIVAQRRRLAERYTSLLADLSAVALPEQPPWARSNWQSYAVRLGPGLEQRRVMEQMHAAGIGVHRGVICCHKEPAYPPGTWRPAAGLAESERATNDCVMLPLFPGLTEPEQNRVVTVLRAVCGE